MLDIKIVLLFIILVSTAYSDKIKAVAVLPNPADTVSGVGSKGNTEHQSIIAAENNVTIESNNVISDEDVTESLSEINRLRNLLIQNPNTPLLIKKSSQALKDLEDDYDLDLGFNYIVVGQYDMVSGEKAAGGDLDIFGVYTPLQDIKIGFKIETRHLIGALSSNDFKNSIGSLYRTSPGFDKESPSLIELWWQIKKENYAFRFGQIQPDNFIDNYVYKSSTRYFMSGALSSNPYNAYPSYGFGIKGIYKFDTKYYIAGEVTDANAEKGKFKSTFFTEKEFYSAVEFGITPKDGSKYHLTLWHRDETDKHVEAKGGVLSLVTTVKENIYLFTRAALSQGADVRRYVAIGAGQSTMFTSNDLTTIAIAIAEPEDSTNARTQTTLESFYRINLYPGVQLTGDIQLLYHPSYSYENWAVIPGFRLRVFY